MGENEERDFLSRLAACLIQVVKLLDGSVLFQNGFLEVGRQKPGIPVAEHDEFRAAMCIHRTAVVPQVRIDDGKIEVDYKILVMVGRRMLPYVQVAIQPFEHICIVDVVIVMQHGYGKALAEAARTDEEEELVGVLHLLNEPCLVHIVAVVPAHGDEVHHTIGDAPCLYSCRFFFHNHDALIVSDNKNKAIC